MRGTMKNIILIIALSLYSTSNFAVTCPNTTAFENKKGWTTRYWDFKQGANTEGWEIIRYAYGSANDGDEFFPRAWLSVALHNDGAYCRYDLSYTVNGQTISGDWFEIKKDRKPNISSRQGEWFSDSDKGGWLCDATSTSPEICSWSWSK